MASATRVDSFVVHGAEVFAPLKQNIASICLSMRDKK